MDYLWTLKKGSEKTFCPKCGQKRFVRFVLTADPSIEAPPEFGRCDRQDECQYFLYPSKKESNKYKGVEALPPPPPQPPSFIPCSFAARFEKGIENQNLYNAFVGIFTKTQINKAFKKYKVGTYSEATIFWQIDENEKIRTGKIMNYLKSGRRDKTKFGFFVHKMKKDRETEVFPDFNLKQCLFGLHLVKKNAIIGIVESEKTAIFMSIVNPDITWLATGGSENLQSYKFEPLFNMNCKVYFYPDKGMENKWAQKINNFGVVKFDLYDLNDKAGVDIFDKFLMKKKWNA